MDIYKVIDVSQFKFTTRAVPFDWRLLHGVDVDEVVRLHDTAALEALIPTLQQGSIDAEPSLSQQNYIQLFRLVQLSVEHLWRMRESHTKLYPVYVQACATAATWKAAAVAYLHLAGRLLEQLQSETGALLTEQALSEVAEAREALEKADAHYNTALDKLEAEDAAARCHTLRRQKLDISWRLVFGTDVQQLVASGSVAQLEQLLPQVVYGNIMAEDPGVLTPRHFRQLLLLAQASLDYLWGICVATSKVMEQQVQQLAAGSAPIPQITTSTEELRAALAAALADSMQLVGASAAHSASPVAAATARQHNCTHIHSSGRLRGHAYASAAAATGGPRACSPVCQCCSSPTATGSCPVHGQVGYCTCAATGPVMCNATGGGLLSSVLLATAGNLKAKMDQLDWDLRVERERTEAMRRTLEETTALLEQLPANQQQTAPVQVPIQQPVQQQQQCIAPTNVRPGQGLIGTPGSRPDSPAGSVRVVIDEEAIRAQERQAAGEQLSQRISNIITSHEFPRKLRQSHSRHTSSGGSRTPAIFYSSVPAADADAAGPSFIRTVGGGAASSRFGAGSPRSSAGFTANLQASSAAAEAAASLAASAAEAAAAAAAEVEAAAQGAQKQPQKQRISQVPVFGLPGLVSPHNVGFQSGLPAQRKSQAAAGSAPGEQGEGAGAAAKLHRTAGLMAAAAGAAREQQLQEQALSAGCSPLSKVKDLAHCVSPKRMLAPSNSGNGWTAQ